MLVRTTAVRSLVMPVALAALLGSCAQPLGRIQSPTQPMLVAHGAGAPTATQANAAEIALGKQLFFDKRLSKDSSISCATCHDPKFGLANNTAVATGVGGLKGKRNVPTILSAGRQPHQFWDGRAKTLEEQALGPIQAPDEMAMPLPELMTRLQAIPDYARQFQAIYGGTVTPERLGKAVAAFERTFMAPDDVLAELLRGDQRALSTLSERQRAGYFVFRTKGCIKCHDYTDMRDEDFHNVGIGVDKPVPDIGRMKVTGNAADWAKFKTPTLRNVSDTAPYMHDGSMKTLREVVDHYDKGGIANKNLDPKIEKLDLEEWQKQDLVSFLSVLRTPDAIKRLK
jgi:cytochrome c peroxidase